MVRDDEGNVWEVVTTDASQEDWYDDWCACGKDRPGVLLSVVEGSASLHCAGCRKTVYTEYPEDLTLEDIPVEASQWVCPQAGGWHGMQRCEDGPELTLSLRENPAPDSLVKELFRATKDDAEMDVRFRRRVIGATGTSDLGMSVIASKQYAVDEAIYGDLYQSEFVVPDDESAYAGRVNWAVRHTVAEVRRAIQKAKAEFEQENPA